MAKKMVGCLEMGLCWFQIAWENSCALDKVLTFNQIDKKLILFCSGVRIKA